MKLGKRLLTFIITIALCMNLGVISPKAASAEVTIAFSANTVTIGSSVSVTVNVKSQDWIAYTIYVTYDANVLQYNSGSGAAQANGSGGTLTLSGNAGATTLNFTALANGTCCISTSGSEVYDINSEAVAITHAGANLTVETVTETTTATEADDNTSEEKEPTTEETDNRSNNCNLSSLKVSPGTLVPEFSPAQTSYFVQLEKDATSIVVSASAEDSKASTRVSGADDLQPGENTVKVTVTAENGSVRVYSLTVAVGEIVDPTEVKIDGKVYHFVNTPSELVVPEGYSPGTVEYDGNDMMAYESPNKKITLVCLADEEDNKFWYIFNSDDNSFIPYVEYSSNLNRYIILPMPTSVGLPAGFEPTNVVIGGNEIDAYKSMYMKDDNIYLIYAMNISGDEGFYLYDVRECAFMRYVPENLPAQTIIATQTEAVATISDVKKEKEEGFFTKNMLVYIIVILSLLFVALLVLVIVIAIKRKNISTELEQAEDMIAQLSSGKVIRNEELEKILDEEAELDNNKKEKETVEKEAFQNVEKMEDDFVDSAFLVTTTDEMDETGSEEVSDEEDSEKTDLNEDASIETGTEEVLSEETVTEEALSKETVSEEETTNEAAGMEELGDISKIPTLQILNEESVGETSEERKEAAEETAVVEEQNTVTQLNFEKEVDDAMKIAEKFAVDIETAKQLQRIEAKRAEMKRAYLDFEKQSEEISSKIMKDYHAQEDSAFNIIQENVENNASDKIE